jgi:hypothetical protein
MSDPIVDEVRRVRDEHAARFNYDLDAIFQDIKEREKRSGLKFVSFTAGRIEQRIIPDQTTPRLPGAPEEAGANSRPAPF